MFTLFIQQNAEVKSTSSPRSPRRPSLAIIMQQNEVTKISNIEVLTLFFISCSKPSGDNTQSSYEQSISSLQIPKKLPPININTAQQSVEADTKTSSLRG